MRDRLPTPPDGRPPIPDFTAVPRKYRHDGWTPERQRAFIDALAATGSVSAAAKRINMSAEGAYYLRRQPGAEGFAAAWAAALDHGVQHLTDLAIDRATHGTPVPIFWRGEQVGERRRYNDRLLMFILKHHLPARYGGARLPPPPGRETEQQAQAQAEAADAFDAWLRPRATGLMGLMRAHRLTMRRAVVAHLIGDVDGAAAAEHTARNVEQQIAGDPDGWLNGELWAGIATHNLPGGTEDAPAWCRDGAQPAPPDPTPPEGALWLNEAPPWSPLALLPAHYPLHTIQGGPTLSERQAARQDAKARRDAAQAEMDAAYEEESWAAWRGRQSGGSMRIKT